MYPDKTRLMGTNYVYETTTSATYNYHEAVDFCLSSYDARLPTIYSINDAHQIAMHQQIAFGSEYA